MPPALLQNRAFSSLFIPRSMIPRLQRESFHPVTVLLTLSPCHVLGVSRKNPTAHGNAFFGYGQADDDLGPIGA